MASPGWSPALHRPLRNLLGAACRALSPRKPGAGSCYFGVHTEPSRRAAMTHSTSTLILSGHECFTDPFGPEQWEVAAMCLPFCATRGSNPWIRQPTQAVGGVWAFPSSFLFFFYLFFELKNQGVCAGGRHHKPTAVLVGLPCSLRCHSQTAAGSAWAAQDLNQPRWNES